MTAMHLHRNLSILLYSLGTVNILVISSYLISFTIPLDEVNEVDISRVRTYSYLDWKQRYPDWSEEQLQTWTNDIVSEYIDMQCISQEIEFRILS